MTTSIEGVEVELGRLDADWRKFGIKVKVWSKVKPHLKATNEIDPGEALSRQHLLDLVGVAGGACAEYLGRRYGDNLDSVTVASNALKAFAEECRLQAALSDGVREKVERLKTHKELLTEPERELLERCGFFLARGDALTPKEILALDVMIGRVHSFNL